MPILGLTTGISAKTEDNAQSLTRTQVATPAEISGKVRNNEKPPVSLSAAQHSDSNSNAFSDMLKKIRMMNEMCPKCLMPH